MYALMVLAQIIGMDLTNYTLTFDDEFTKLSLSDSRVFDGSNWYTHNEACCMSTTNGFSTAMHGLSDTPSPFSLIPGGGLDIRLQLTGTAWSSGVLTSVSNDGKGFAQQYGYFEMRAKLPSGWDTWPAFWMLDQASKVCGHTCTPNVHGEIDIFEYISRDQANISSTLHDWVAGTVIATQISNLPTVPADGNFHTYGMDWTVDTISFFYDNVPVFHTPTPPSMKQPYYLILDLGIGSGWPTTQTTPVNDMQVAYVRAFQQK